MRKDALVKLLRKHQNDQASKLTTVLEKNYSTFPGDHDITFKDVIVSLQGCGLAPIGLGQSTAKNHSDDNNLFYQFITNQPYEEEKRSNINRLDVVPKAVSDYALAPLLDAKSVANLSACSFTLYQQTKRIPFWKDKLLTLGYNSDQLGQMIHANAIENYKKLYRTLLDVGNRQKLLAWELFCLSGEPTAIQHAIQSEGLTAQTKGLFDRNALHYVAWSGSVEAMRYAIETLKIDPKSVDNNGKNALHYAAWDGSVEGMRYAIATLKVDPKSVDGNGKNALHYAAWGGSVHAVLFLRLLNHLLNLNLEPTVRDAQGHDAFWHAEQDDTIHDALNLPIEKIKVKVLREEKEVAHFSSHTTVTMSPSKPATSAASPSLSSSSSSASFNSSRDEERHYASCSSYTK